LIRTDFSDDLLWERVKRLAVEPTPEDQFQACVTFVDDPTLSGITPDQALRALDPADEHGFIFIVDSETLRNEDLPILVVDCIDQPGQQFRVVPAWMWSVENNLSLSNMGFEEFVEAVSQDGVFRGF